MDGFISYEDLARADRTVEKMIQLVCGRPAMFVGDGSFALVAVYLQGYDAAVGNMTGKGMLWNTDLVQFSRWLGKKVSASGEGTQWSPRLWFVYVEEMYPDDESRLRQLPILFDEFLRDRERSIMTV